jgi:DNA polymerase III alpha subunit
MHSCASLLEGASAPGALLDRAQELGFRRIALISDLEDKP